MSSDEENTKMRDIYAFYGYSMFLAQQLEGLLSQAIFAFVIIPEKLPFVNEISPENRMNKWGELVDSEDAKLLRKTMGSLITKLRKEGIFSEDIELRFREALKERNFLAHQFFKDYLSKFYTEKGQDECILYLRKAGGLIQQTLDEFTPIVRRGMEKYGYDKDFVDSYIRNSIESAKKGG